MSTNIDNNQHDAFNELFRQKLENHTLPVDESAWAAIQKGMVVQKKKRLIPFWWMSAAAVLVLFFILIANYNNDLKKETAVNVNSEKVKEKEISTEKIQTVENEGLKETISNKQEELDYALDEPKKVLANKTPLKNTSEAKVTINENKVLELANIEILTNSVLDNNSNEIKTEILIAQETTDSKLEVKKKELLEIADNDFPDWENPTDIQNDDGWGLLASMGTGGSSTGSPRFLDAGNGELYSKLLRAPHLRTNATILSPSDFNSKKFHAPLSFGLRVAKILNKNISVESGLVYTYLLTDLESPNYKARLNLHYMGIPVNLKVQIWDANKWSVYASGGLLLEKGLRSVYVQDQYVGNQIVTTTASTNIEGLQWSVNAAVGVGYNILKGIDLFFEPEFSYFFDNDQPLSIRSDMRFAPGVEGGIRFRL